MCEFSSIMFLHKFLLSFSSNFLKSGTLIQISDRLGWWCPPRPWLHWRGGHGHIGCWKRRTRVVGAVFVESAGYSRCNNSPMYKCGCHGLWYHFQVDKLVSVGTFYGEGWALKKVSQLLFFTVLPQQNCTFRNCGIPRIYPPLHAGARQKEKRNMPVRSTSYAILSLCSKGFLFSIFFA